jgi:hypothetical protein
MSALLVLTLLAVDPEARHPLDSAARLTFELGAGASPQSEGVLGCAIDFGWLPLPFLRLHTSVGMASRFAMTRSIRDTAQLNHAGAMRMLFGLDGLLPFVWGELFMGLESGATYSEAVEAVTYTDCMERCGIVLAWRPSMRVRGGVDFTRLRPVLLGVEAAYGFNYERHWGELQGRFGFEF